MLADEKMANCSGVLSDDARRAWHATQWLAAQAQPTRIFQVILLIVLTLTVALAVAVHASPPPAVSQSQAFVPHRPWTPVIVVKNQVVPLVDEQ